MREVTEEEARELATKEDLIFCGECSAMQNINIGKNIDKLADEINEI